MAGGTLKRRVLLVDDEPAVLDVIRRQLAHRLNPDLYEMLYASSGQEALALMEERKIVEARGTLWWSNVRKHFNINDNFVHLEGNLVQVGTPKERSKEEQQF